MGKRAVIPPGEATSDIRVCDRCGGPMLGQKSFLIETSSGLVARYVPLCLTCYGGPKRLSPGPGDRQPHPALLRLGRLLNGNRPAPKPHVVVVRREQPAETVTGLRAKLAAKNLPKWEIES